MPLQHAVRFLRVLLPAPPTASLAGHLPPTQCSESVAGNRGLPRSCSCRPSNYHGPVRLAPVYPPVALWRRAFRLKECNRPPTFWSKPVSNFGFSKLTRVQTTVHLRCAYGTCLASTPLSLLAVSAPCHQDGPSSEEYIVPGASYPIVTHRACPGRQLLVAQQVAASTAFIRRSKCDKAKASFAVLSTSCRLTGDGRRHVSH